MPLEMTATTTRSTFLLISSPNFSNFENFTLLEHRNLMLDVSF